MCFISLLQRKNICKKFLSYLHTKTRRELKGSRRVLLLNLSIFK